MRSLTRTLAALCVGAALAACSGDEPSDAPRDAGTNTVRDAGPKRDAGPRDAGTRDGGATLPASFSLRPTLPRPPIGGQLPADLLPPQ